MRYRYSKYLPGFILLCDLLLLNLLIFHSIFISFDNVLGFRIILILNLAWVVISHSLKVYKVPRPLLLKESLSRFLQALIVHLFLTITLLYILTPHNNVYKILTIFYILIIVLVACHRFLLSTFLDHIRRRGYNGRKILILGESAIANRLADHFSQHPEYGYDLINNNLEDSLKGLSGADFSSKLEQYCPNEIFICYKVPDPELIGLVKSFSEENVVKVKLVSDVILSNSYARVINYDHLPELYVNNNIQLRKHVKFVKRSFDILFSSTLLVAGSPVLFSLYVITRITSKGPAYYYQERIGLNGKPFKIIKFRSMRIDAERFGPELAKDNDPRVTKWGKVIRKTRLDELPQFWNVLKGDMSIVGPRPERKHYIEKITQKTPQYSQLLTVKPGITSIGQVHYGYAENVEQMCERMEFDLLYLRNVSLNSDLKLILGTIKVMIQGKGK